jgi:hypothetical protein
MQGLPPHTLFPPKPAAAPFTLPLPSTAPGVPPLRTAGSLSRRTCAAQGALHAAIAVSPLDARRTGGMCRRQVRREGRRRTRGIRQGQGGSHAPRPEETVAAAPQHTFGWDRVGDAGRWVDGAALAHSLIPLRGPRHALRHRSGSRNRATMSVRGPDRTVMTLRYPRRATSWSRRACASGSVRCRRRRGSTRHSGMLYRHSRLEPRALAPDPDGTAATLTDPRRPDPAGGRVSLLTMR